MKTIHSSKPGLLLKVAAMMALWFAMSQPSYAQPIGGDSTSAATVVKGDVLNIEGDLYTIKDISGHEVELRVNGDTKFEDRVKVGDKIIAEVTREGQAKSIRVAIP